MGAFLVVSVQRSAACSQLPAEPSEHSHYLDRRSRNDYSAARYADAN